MMCYRCEHRARFLEGGPRPRFECGEIKTSKVACYMYRPCYPLVLAKLDKKDPRPWPGSGIFAARSMVDRVYEEAELFGEWIEGGVVFLYKLKEG